MCLAVTPACSRNSSVARCRIVPLPPEAKFSAPGLLLSSAMNSLLLVAGTLAGLTTSTIGVAPTIAIGVKSPGMSKGSDFSTLGKITTLFDTTDSVLPSGAERASACRPTTPPAPGWFSTTTDALSAFDSAGWAARVMASTPEPVALGRMKRTVPDCALRGEWPCAGRDRAAEAASIERREKRLR